MCPKDLSAMFSITLVLRFVLYGIYIVRYGQNCKYATLNFSTSFHSFLMISFKIHDFKN